MSSTRTPQSKKRKISELSEVVQIEGRRINDPKHKSSHKSVPFLNFQESVNVDHRTKQACESFSERMNALEKEALLVAAGLGSDPASLHALFEKLQEFCRKIQRILGNQYRLHVLVESAISGVEVNRKYRGCVPLFSSTLLPAISSTTVGSAVASVVLSEGLAIFEAVASADKAVEIDTFDLISTLKAPELRLSSWIPGEVVDASKCRGRSLLGLTVMAQFDDSPSRRLKAADNLASINAAPPIFMATNINTTAQFVIPSASRIRLLAPNPMIFNRMMNMPKGRFIEVYKTFLYELHEKGIAAKKMQGKILFDRFNPPYFNGRVAFLLPHKKYGVQRLRSFEANGPSVPTVHSLDKARNRPLACCFLTLWLEMEKNSKERLLRIFAKHHEAFTFDEHELISFQEGACGAISPLSTARQQTVNLATGQLGAKGIISHKKYRLTAMDIETLKSLHPPCSAVIDAFFLLSQMMTLTSFPPCSCFI